MADGTPPLRDESAAALEGGAVVFALAGELYAMSVAAIDAITPPPALCRVPHAPPGLLGAGNLGGQVVPVLDLGALLPGNHESRRYDGNGEVLRLRVAGGSVGLWIDRVERLIGPGRSDAEAITTIDPEPLIEQAMAAPCLAMGAQNPLGDVNEIVVQAAAVATDSFILVEAAGERVQLTREAVTELIAPPPMIAVPGAPAGFRGVAIVRGEALPILSLAALMGLPESATPAVFAAAILPDGNRLLLGFDRLIGLRVRRRRTGRRWVDRLSGSEAEEGRALDLATMIPHELRRIVADFAATADAEQPAAAPLLADATPYLAFVAAGQLCGLAAAAVDRVVGPQRPIALPRQVGAAAAMDDAIELRGQIVPVLALRERLGVARSDTAPSAYVVVRGAAGLIGIGVERVERLVSLRPDQIAAAPSDQDLIEGVAVLGDGADLLRILAPDRLGDAG